MTGKREKNKSKSRLPAVVLLVGVLAAIWVPAGAAVASPLEQAAAEHEPDVRPEPVKREKIAEELSPAPQEEPWTPVEESAAVEDTYFTDAAFLGDSRTEGFHLYSGLNEGAYFYAVGATVESVFSKNAWQTEGGKIPLLDAMAQGEYGKIYVMLGVNELGWNGTDIYKNQAAKLIDRLREDHPQSQIVLQSLPPVSAKQEAKGTYVNNGRIALYNGVLRRLAEEKNCFYVNVAEAVTDENGCLRADWTFDGVHLNSAGCAAWLDYLRTHSVPPWEEPETPAPVRTIKSMPEKNDGPGAFL